MNPLESQPQTDIDDPFAIYRVGKTASLPEAAKKPDPFSYPEDEIDNDDPFSQYRTKPPEATEYTLTDIPRAQWGLAARAGETLIGAPKALQEGFSTILDVTLGKGIEWLTGKEQPEVRKALKTPSALFQMLPNASEVKEKVTKPLSKAITGDENILEPKSEPEQFAQEFTKTVTELSTPGSGIATWTARIGLGLAAESSKELAKQLGFEPSTQELVKMGTLGVATLANIGNAPEMARNLYQATKNAMSRGTRFNATPLQNSIARLRNSEWFRVGDPASTQSAKRLLEDLEDQINRGSMSVRDGIRMREVINEAAENIGAFAVDPKYRKAHAGYVNQVRDALIDGMEQTVGRTHPNWWATYQDANAVYGITQRSNALAQYISKVYTKPIVSDTGKVLFGAALAKGTAGVAQLGLATAAVATGAKAIQIANRLRSPTLRRYYSDVLAAAGRQDAVALSTAMEKFDKAAEKEERNNKAKRVLRNPNQKEDRKSSPKTDKTQKPQTSRLL